MFVNLSESLHKNEQPEQNQRQWKQFTKKISNTVSPQTPQMQKGKPPTTK